MFTSKEFKSKDDLCKFINKMEDPDNEKGDIIANETGYTLFYWNHLEVERDKKESQPKKSYLIYILLAVLAISLGLYFSGIFTL